MVHGASHLLLLPEREENLHSINQLQDKCSMSNSLLISPSLLLPQEMPDRPKESRVSPCFFPPLISYLSSAVNNVFSG